MGWLVVCAALKLIGRWINMNMHSMINMKVAAQFSREVVAVAVLTDKGIGNWNCRHDHG